MSFKTEPEEATIEESPNAASASPASQRDQSPPVIDSISTEDALLPADFDGPVSPSSWESMFANQEATPIAPILGFTDSDYLAAMMSFSDQSWFS